jgi:hypothetical protein
MRGEKAQKNVVRRSFPRQGVGANVPKEHAIEVLAVELDEQLAERHVLLPAVKLCCDLEEQQLSGIAPVFDQTLEAGDVN